MILIDLSSIVFMGEDPRSSAGQKVFTSTTPLQRMAAPATDRGGGLAQL